LKPKSEAINYKTIWSPPVWASRHLSPDMTRDVFGERTYPDATMLEKAKIETARACQKHNVRWHAGCR